MLFLRIFHDLQTSKFKEMIEARFLFVLDELKNWKDFEENIFLDTFQKEKKSLQKERNFFSLGVCGYENLSEKSDRKKILKYRIFFIFSKKKNNKKIINPENYYFEFSFDVFSPETKLESRKNTRQNIT